MGNRIGDWSCYWRLSCTGTVLLIVELLVITFKVVMIENCCAEFEIIRENINAKNKTTVYVVHQ